MNYSTMTNTNIFTYMRFMRSFASLASDMYNAVILDICTLAYRNSYILCPYCSTRENANIFSKSHVSTNRCIFKKYSAFRYDRYKILISSYHSLLLRTFIFSLTVLTISIYLYIVPCNSKTC